MTSKEAIRNLSALVTHFNPFSDESNSIYVAIDALEKQKILDEIYMCIKPFMGLDEWRKEVYRLAEKESKYRWHDLLKNPDDLPTEVGNYLVFAPMCNQIAPDEVEYTPQFSVQPYISYRDENHWGLDILQDEVWLWKKIEPFA